LANAQGQILDAESCGVYLLWPGGRRTRVRGSIAGIALVRLSLTSDNHDQTDQAVPQASARTRAGRWRKGVSGNPKGGALGKISEAEQEAKRVDLYQAILKDVGGPLTALEEAFAHEAARQLVRASTSKDDALRVRLVNAGGKIIDRIKASIAARCTGPKKTAFDEYVERLNAGGKR
jgi:hypothetical protein